MSALLNERPPLYERLAAIAHSYRLEAMYVFGSRAAEIAARAAATAGLQDSADAAEATAASSSDVDIGVHPRLGSHLSAQDRVRLTLELEGALGAGRVDVVVLPEANAFLAADAVRGELLYARDPVAEAEIQLYHLRRAGDLAPFFRERWRDLVGGEL